MSRTRFLSAALAAIAPALVLHCSSGGSGKAGCTPGASSSCACSSGQSGAQTCAPDGSGYGACSCTAPDAASGSGGDSASVGEAGAGAEAGDTGVGSDGGLVDGSQGSGDGAIAQDGGGFCKGGHYTGPFAGPYISPLTGVGLPLPMAGTWNGAEALAGNDGGSPGPDGGPPSSYLSDSGVYTGPGNFGGSGSWSAAHP